jgi:2-alkyl-3-oxoalkanoate reductase
LTKKAVVVLGAGGFIGRRIVGALAVTGWARPIAAGRNLARLRFGAGVESYQLDATDPATLERALESAAAVVSCVAGTTANITRSGELLFDAAARMSPPPRVVYLSSMAVYGSARGVTDEAAPLLGDLGEYSVAKSTVDKLADGRPEIVRLRPGIVYGPESPWWSGGIGCLLVQRRLGDLGARGAGACNLVHVDDVAQAVVRALEVPEAAGEAFNLGSPDPPTWNEYFRRYARALRVAPLRRISLARLLVELGLVGPALKIAEKALGRSDPWLRYPAIRPWLTRLCKHDIRMDVRKAERLLGLRWRPLEAGLDETAAWFLSGART